MRQKSSTVASSLCALVTLLALKAQCQITVKDSKVSACTSSDQYFDSTALKCQRCPLKNQVQLVPQTSKLGCECPPGYKLSANQQDQFFPSCEKCPTSQPAASQDKTKCMACADSQTFRDNIKDCVCPKNTYVIEDDQSNQKRCSQQCKQGVWPGPLDATVPACTPCPYEGQSYNELNVPFTCECDQTAGFIKAADKCLSTKYTDNFTSAVSPYAVSFAIQISYSAIETEAADGSWQTSPNTYTSGMMQYYYLDAAVGCTEFKDVKKCQLLANLCVLQLYNSDSIVCKLYKEQVRSVTSNLAYPDYYKNEGFKDAQLPWLYYEDLNAQQIIQQPKKVQFRASFDYQNLDIGIVSKLRFKLAIYDLEGNFYGFEDLYDQLTVCKQPSEDQDSVYRIGVTLHYFCAFDLKKLISSNAFERPKMENLFFELYLLDYNDDLIDVPVLIENTASESGGYPNQQDDMTRWILTRRFFLFDTISGVRQNEFPGGTPVLVRYPKEMTFEVELDQNNEEMIYSPYLRIRYRERTSSYITSNNAEAEVEFGTYYKSSTAAFWESAMIIFYVCLAILILIVLIKMQVLLSKPVINSDQQDGFRTGVIAFIVYTLDFFSTIYFWYLFFMIGYWFVFYKMQERVFLFVPTHETYWTNFEQYDWLFAWAAGSKLVTVLFKVYFDQTSFDVYLIDWERPKPQQSEIPVMENQKQVAKRSVEKLDVNAWRSLFLINELNELQNYRIISSNVTLFLYGLFMEGIGLRYWTNQDPNLVQNKTNSDENWVIFFFVSTLVMYTIAGIQYGGRYLIKKWFPLPTEEFTDLCSVTNISVLIFDDSFGGYYIHGRSPCGFTEISTENLRRSLEQESRGKGQIRGLSPEEPDLQTYQIYIPLKLFETYRTTYVQELNTTVNEAQQKNQALSNAASQFFSRDNAIPKGLDMDRTETTRKIMNKLFMRCIEQVRSEPKKYIKNRSFMDRLFNRPPIDDLNKDRPVLFKDKWYSFSNFFLMGMDWDFVMLDSCILSFVIQVSLYDYELDIKLLLGILVAYITDQGLFFIRNWRGRRNISRHTLVDDKFLF